MSVSSEKIGEMVEKTGSNLNSAQRERVDSTHPNSPKYRHSGMFKPGPDPRRGSHTARNRQARKTLAEMCAKQTPQAVEFLIATMNNVDECSKVRMTACREILDRGHGKPVGRDVLMTLDGNQAAAKVVDPFTATEAELNQIVKLALQSPRQDDIVIDADVTVVEELVEK
jgi:hypothetical protein